MNCDQCGRLIGCNEHLAAITQTPGDCPHCHGQSRPEPTTTFMFGRHGICFTLEEFEALQRVARAQIELEKRRGRNNNGR